MTAEDRLRQGIREDIIRSTFHDPEMQALGNCPGLNLKVVKMHAERLLTAGENAKAAKREKGENPETVNSEVLQDAKSARSILVRLKSGGVA